MDDLLGNVPAILNYGFLGLSVLLLLLGYLTLRNVTDPERGTPSPEVVALCRFFLLVCVGCLLLTGPLQVGLMVADRSFAKRINVNFDMPTRRWEDTFGAVRLRHDGVEYVLPGENGPRAVRADGTVDVDVEDVIDLLRRHRVDVRAAQRVLEETDAKLEASEGEARLCEAKLEETVARLRTAPLSVPRSQPTTGRGADAAPIPTQDSPPAQASSPTSTRPADGDTSVRFERFSSPASPRLPSLEDPNDAG